jgi:hypothetical protein
MAGARRFGAAGSVTRVTPRAALQFLTSHLRGYSGFRGSSGQLLGVLRFSA